MKHSAQAKACGYGFSNPASDRIHLHGIEAGEKVSIVDALGCVVLSTLASEKGVTVSSLLSGSYIVATSNARAILLKE